MQKVLKQVETSRYYSHVQTHFEPATVRSRWLGFQTTFPKPLSHLAGRNDLKIPQFLHSHDFGDACLLRVTDRSRQNRRKSFRPTIKSQNSMVQGHFNFVLRLHAEFSTENMDVTF